ncbi:Hypothetical_protein [Hexamita inflata]|uniref:Hypothetical_protein n=1 Tax=Hexamita inflata TaxID=28002 RepID=A0AA86RBB5_9EUKA|nr:Hypothetical protein HINF_LOCUS58436 [Hexamita inflata]
MRPSQVVLDNPPKEDQIFEGIPLQNVISYVYSRRDQMVKSYATKDGTYYLGQYGFQPKSLFSSCKAVSADKMVVLSPVIFVDKQGKLHQISSLAYTHVPYKIWLRRLDDVVMLQELKENIFSSANTSMKRQQSFLSSNTQNNSEVSKIRSNANSNSNLQRNFSNKSILQKPSIAPNRSLPNLNHFQPFEPFQPFNQILNSNNNLNNNQNTNVNQKQNKLTKNMSLPNLVERKNEIEVIKCDFERNFEKKFKENGIVYEKTEQNWYI